MTPASVIHAARTRVLLRTQCVNDTDIRCSNRLQDVLLRSDHFKARRAGIEVHPGTGLGRTALDRPPFLAPLLQSAVQYSRVLVAEYLKHPPQPCRPPMIGGRITHHKRVATNAESRHRLCKLFARWKHEMVFG